MELLTMLNLIYRLKYCTFNDKYLSTKTTTKIKIFYVTFKFIKHP